MEAQREKRLGALGLFAVIVWLLVGPYLCLMLVDSLLTPKSSDSILFYTPAWIASVLAGTALFLLPQAFWKRISSFLIYVPVVSIILLFAALYISCMLFHDCL